METALNIVVLGLSLSSSWGNGHATTYRGLLRELAAKGHQITFLERDVPWYAASRDLQDVEYCSLKFYQSIDELKANFSSIIGEADLVIVGSYVPEGVAVGKFVIEIAEGVTAFYDIDTPVTLAKIRREDYEYLHPDLIKSYDLYLSFTGGPTLDMLEREYGAPLARALYCSFDPALYYPEVQLRQWDLGYLGTYSKDRQPPLQQLLIDAATQLPNMRFVVAGPQYPAEIRWPLNLEYLHHLSPAEHRKFYNSQRFTLNVTREDMIAAGYSPSVRLFEAAACGVPVISDYWNGLDTIFEPGKEILISKSTKDTVTYLVHVSDTERQTIGASAREKVMACHTAAHRATELENYYNEVVCKKMVQSLPVQS